MEESLSALIVLRGKSLASYVARIFPDIVGKRWFPLTAEDPKKNHFDQRHLRPKPTLQTSRPLMQPITQTHNVAAGTKYFLRFGPANYAPAVFDVLSFEPMAESQLKKCLIEHFA